MTTKTEEVLNEMKKCINKVDMYEKAERDIKNLTNLSLDDLVEEIAMNGLNDKAEKVKVPKFIADWIETWQGDGRTILHAMSAAEYEVTKYNNPVGKWLTGGRITEHDIKNQMIFVSAWLNGYEIEEEKAKFEVGEYYTIGLGISSREIFMVISAEDKLKAKSYRVSYDHFRIMSTALKGNSFVVTDSKLATDEEIKLFKRAEMYHKHGRKLDELKVGDFVRDKTDGEI